MEKKRYIILTGGTLNQDFLTDYFRNNKMENIICVDGALELADKLQLPIDYLVGDFDTVSPILLQKYKKDIDTGKKKIELKEYNPIKDETDTELAISIAVENGAEEIILLGATGSRIDHMLANIHLLMQPLSAGINAYILDEYNKIYLINKNTVIRKKEIYGPYVSLLPFGGHARAVTLTGFKYNISKVDFKVGESLGISNELLAEEGTIEWEQGVLAVFEVKD